MKKIVGEFKELGWTLGGTGLVLITLSGQTRTWGIWISLSSLFVYLLGVYLHKED